MGAGSQKSRRFRALWRRALTAWRPFHAPLLPLQVKATMGCDATLPTAEERVWISSFSTFCKRVNSLKSDHSPSGHEQLYLLLNGAIFIQKTELKVFFSKQRHTKAFLDAYLRFMKKVLKLCKTVDMHIKHDERVRIIERTQGRIKMDFNTWKEIAENNNKKWWQFW